MLRCVPQLPSIHSSNPCRGEWVGKHELAKGHIENTMWGSGYHCLATAIMLASKQANYSMSESSGVRGPFRRFTQRSWISVPPCGANCCHLSCPCPPIPAHIPQPLALPSPPHPFVFVLAHLTFPRSHTIPISDLMHPDTPSPPAPTSPIPPIFRITLTTSSESPCQPPIWGGIACHHIPVLHP